MAKQVGQARCQHLTANGETMAYQGKGFGKGQGRATQGSGRAAGSATGATPRVASPKKPTTHSAPAWDAQRWAQALPPVVASLGLAFDEQALSRLAAYMAMLSHWNSTYNLTALRDPQDMLTHHLGDCLAVLGPLARHLAQRPPRPDGSPWRVLDVGSGGGLPGVVLAICLPQVQVTCVDTVGKKAAFIRQVAAELKLPQLRAEHARVEQLHGRHDVITSRAFASLADFVGLTREVMADGGVWMAMKGKQPDDELQALPSDIDVFHVEQLSVPGLDAQRCLVWMRQQQEA